ncbi:hypothetical protein GGH12_003492 [Coemansia sp. RSA 1822]|nr:hypothetical protein LPJ76_004486 [Coemansia sp. RSA 638]KAJ2540426.1 hypothetical protein GGF49_004461 [Coemansia sp. RSA 1853]KAJ2562088.1 hypothetical protein GGH12_003492 [Coemansia sp. RSA 1822]
MFSNPRKRKPRGHSDTRASKRPHRETRPKRKQKAPGIPTVSTAKRVASRTIASELNSLSISDRSPANPVPGSDHNNSDPEVEPTPKRVTFAEHSRSSTPDSDQNTTDDNNTVKPTVCEPADCMSSALPKLMNIMQRFVVNSKTERSLDYVANRTMAALLHEREYDVARHIVINGDSGLNRLCDTGTKSSKRAVNLRKWPSVEYYRYMESEQMRGLKAMGIGVDSGERYEDTELEEPGMEWDVQQLCGVFESEDVSDLADSTEDVDESNSADPTEDVDESGSTDSTEDMDVSDSADPTEDLSDPTDSTKDVDISDPTQNGGIGLVIKRNPRSSPIASLDSSLEFLTKHHLMHPQLASPRYTHIPLPDEFQCTSRPDITDYESLIGTTRVQVLNQVLALNHMQGLSKFVSRTVAEEAVKGVVQTWHVVRGFQRAKAAQKYGRERIMARQWIDVLVAALSAGIPPQVIARSYYRLERFCDTVPK